MFEIIIFSALAIIIGLAVTFFGYPFFRIILPIWAFFAGLMFGINGFALIMGGGFLSVSLGLIVGFVFGLIFAAIAYFAYELAVILFGASLGFALGSGLLMIIGLNEGVITFLAGVAVAVIFAAGFAVLSVPRLLIVLGTAFGGSIAVITGIFVLFGQLPADAASFEIAKYSIGNSFLWLAVWIALAAFGSVAQLGMTRGESLSEAFVVEGADSDVAPEGNTASTEETPKNS